MVLSKFGKQEMYIYIWFCFGIEDIQYNMHSMQNCLRCSYDSEDGRLVFCESIAIYFSIVI